MRRVICVLLGFQLLVSGCSEHLSDHCMELSAETALPAEDRENYHFVITPITDVAGECYCHVEDAAIVTLTIVFFAGWFVVQGMAEGYKGYGRETFY